VKNQMVVRFKDQAMAKGTSSDFFPAKAFFHLESGPGQVRRVDVEDLKAIFFVKSLSGNPDRDDTYKDSVAGGGRKMAVEFIDGETVIGYCLSYSKDRPGFFLVPADNGSNNERIFAIQSACRSVDFL